MGYIAWPPDSHTYMWADFKRKGTPPPPGIICPHCTQRLEFSTVNPNYRPPRSYYDLSSCFDGDYLVSPALRDFWTAHGLVGLDYKAIPKSSRYFVLQCSNVLEYVPGPNLHMEECCPYCGKYKSVWGVTKDGPRFEGVNDPIEHGVYVSDLHVGYYPQKGPLLVVGIETWKEMLKQGFKGLGNGKPIRN